MKYSPNCIFWTLADIGRCGEAMASEDCDRDERESAAAYVAELSGDLSALARRHGLDALSYILDMARLEAEAVSRPIARRS